VLLRRWAGGVRTKKHFAVAAFLPVSLARGPCSNAEKAFILTDAAGHSSRYPLVSQKRRRGKGPLLQYPLTELLATWALTGVTRSAVKCCLWDSPPSHVNPVSAV